MPHSDEALTAFFLKYGRPYLFHDTFGIHYEYIENLPMDFLIKYEYAEMIDGTKWYTLKAVSKKTTIETMVNDLRDWLSKQEAQAK